jgi:hypothetical protein
MRSIPTLTLAVAALMVAALAPSPAGADDRARRDRTHGTAILAPPGPPPARTPSVLRGGDPGLERFDDGRRGHGRVHRPDHHRRSVIVFPQTVVVGPSPCWQPGYWTYQWVPQTYTYSTWVAGHWSPAGYWIDGHYAPSQLSSGYYHPLWVEGYYTGC